MVPTKQVNISEEQQEILDELGFAAGEDAGEDSGGSSDW